MTKHKHRPCPCGCGELADECMRPGSALNAFAIGKPETDALHRAGGAAVTLDTDFVRLNLFIATPVIPLKALGLEWPPPERLYVPSDGKFREAQDGDEEAFVMVRTSCSELPDDVADHPHIARGAEYHYLHALSEGVSAS